MPLLVHHQYGRWFKAFFVPACEIHARPGLPGSTGDGGIFPSSRPTIMLYFSDE
jgi:hypothetical protein